MDLDAKSRTFGLDARTEASDYGATYYRPSAVAKTKLALGATNITEQVEHKTFTTAPKILYYMRNTAYVFLGGDIVYKYHKRGDFFESVNTDETVFIPSVKRPVVTLPVNDTQSLSFGFEICLDHRIEMLKRLIRERNIAAPDFHIMCSVQTGVDTANMCMREGGYMLHASTTFTFTTVHRNRAGKMETVDPTKDDRPGGYLLQLWRLTLDPKDGGLKRAVKAALDSYDAQKTMFASSESKAALAKLRQVEATGTEADLRAHLEWYLGRPGARRPVGAGDPLPAGKRFYTLLSAIRY